MKKISMIGIHKQGDAQGSIDCFSIYIIDETAIWLNILRLTFPTPGYGSLFGPGRGMTTFTNLPAKTTQSNILQALKESLYINYLSNIN